MNSNIISLIYQLKPILDNALYLDGATRNWGNQVYLFGNIPELDSMTIINVVVALEINFGIVVEDEEINAEVFATLDSLANFVNFKLSLLNLVES